MYKSDSALRSECAFYITATWCVSRALSRGEKENRGIAQNSGRAWSQHLAERRRDWLWRQRFACPQELSKTRDPPPPQEQGTAIQLLSAMQMLPAPAEVPVAASRCGKCLAPVQGRRFPLNTRSRSEESCFSKTGALWCCWGSKRDTAAWCHLLRRPEDWLFL